MYIYLTETDSKISTTDPETGVVTEVNGILAPATKAWLESVQESVGSSSVSIAQFPNSIMYIHTDEVTGYDVAPFTEDVPQNVIDEITSII